MFLNQFFEKDYSSALDNFVRAFEAAPLDDTNNDLLNHLSYLQEQTDLPKALKQKILSLKESSRLSYSDLFTEFLSLSLDDVHQWIKSDLVEIIKKIKGRRIPLVIMTYNPMLSADDPKLNQLIRDLAQNFELPLVDNEKNFLEKFARGERAEDYHWFFAGHYDNHLNTKGYGVVAKNVLLVLKKENLLP